ncbi:MAG: phage portal protein [Sedimentisphaerales bacterium]|nr:phage portal protein [Sedimentisphaerales bacterium]
MSFDFSIFNQYRAGVFGYLDEEYVSYLIDEISLDQILHYEKLWNYYRNELYELMLEGSMVETARTYRQGQEYGLPPRITGVRYNFHGGMTPGRIETLSRRKEVVIENDISWRIDAMVDFLFGKDISISSQASHPERAEQIVKVLNTVFQENGGTSFFQELALLGSVYGFVDVLLRWQSATEAEVDVPGGISAEPGSKHLEAVVHERARHLRLEAIEAPRSMPILDEHDYRRIDYYIQHYRQQHNELSDKDDSVHTFNPRGDRVRRIRETHNVEVIGPFYWQRYEDAELVAEGINPLGVVPVVHIQNMSLPLRYEGQSDVEPLIPLQDELNTRLSDRASRITFQSFKMFLGKGIEGFENRVIAPGRLWCTDNPDASIEEFGGDPGSPSEDTHIDQIRESLDKASGVASIAAGILKGRIGNLTSAVALKMTLMGVLAKTERKRKTYGQGIRELCRLILLALDKTGIYPNRPDEREIEIHWPSPLPENLMEKLQEASLKKELGIEQQQVLKELGY